MSLLRPRNTLFFLLKAGSSSRDLPRELLNHSSQHAEVVPRPLVCANLRSETFLFLFSLVEQHTIASPVSPPFHFSLSFSYSPRELGSSTKLLNSHLNAFPQTVLIKISVRFSLRAPLIKTQLFFLHQQKMVLDSLLHEQRVALRQARMEIRAQALQLSIVDSVCEVFLRYFSKLTAKNGSFKQLKTKLMGKTFSVVQEKGDNKLEKLYSTTHSDILSIAVRADHCLLSRLSGEIR